MGIIENLTVEQSKIVDSVTGLKKSFLIIEAFAGSGKTFTTLKILERLQDIEPNKKVAYFVFNNFMKKEIDYKAQLHNIQNTSFFTFHSFMLNQALKNEELKQHFIDNEGNYNIDFQKKGYSYNDILQVLANLDIQGNEIAKAVYTAFREWLSSSESTKKIVNVFIEALYKGKYSNIDMYALSDELDKNRYQIVKGITQLKDTNPQAIKDNVLLGVAIKKAIAYTIKRLKMTHEGYYKRVYEIASKENIDLFKDFDLIIIDEAQDIDPIFFELILKQKEKKGIILLGDEHQSIYAFRGALNMIKTAKEYSTEVKYLTQSFRFKNDIAKLLNIVLKQKENIPEKDIKGIYSHSIKSINERLISKEEVNSYILEHIKEQKEKYNGITGKRELKKRLSKNKIAVIARFNRTLVNIMYNFLISIENSPKDLGDYINISTTEAVAHEFERINKLDFPKKIKIQVEFQNRKSYTEVIKGMSLQDFIKEYSYLLSSDERYSFLMEQENIEKFNKIYELLKSRKKGNIAKSDKNANIVFTTAHGSKGKEYDKVIVCNDFVLENDEEINMSYVALSRVKKELNFYGEENSLYDLLLRHKDEIKKELEEKTTLYFKNEVEVSVVFNKSLNMYQYEIFKEKSLIINFLTNEPYEQIYYIENSDKLDEGIYLSNKDEIIPYSFIDRCEIKDLKGYKKFGGTSVKRDNGIKKKIINVF